jgi:hypothetical protein
MKFYQNITVVFGQRTTTYYQGRRSILWTGNYFVDAHALQGMYNFCDLGKVYAMGVAGFAVAVAGIEHKGIVTRHIHCS